MHKDTILAFQLTKHSGIMAECYNNINDTCPMFMNNTQCGNRQTICLLRTQANGGFLVTSIFAQSTMVTQFKFGFSLLCILTFFLSGCSSDAHYPPVVQHTKTTRGDATVHIARIPLRDFELSVSLSNSQAQNLESVTTHTANLLDAFGVLPPVVVNASFWSAKTSFPIGPTALYGEWVHIGVYKNWSSLIVTEDGPVLSDVEPKVELSIGGVSYPIHAVNLRQNEDDVVLYNHYCGTSVPWLDSAGVGELWLKSVANQGEQFGDSSERKLDSIEFVEQKAAEYFAKSTEASREKVALIYLDEPVLNGKAKLMVHDKRSGIVPMHKGMVVITGLPHNALSVGDTVLLHSSTGFDAPEQSHIITSTPRLMRDGAYQHEAKQEGTTSKRFINGRVPRSGIGWNERGDTAFILCVTAEQPGRYGGVSLQEFAEIFKNLGCYNAINLDGGGSTSMTIEGELVTSYLGKQPRRVSTTLVALPKVSPKPSDGKVR